jgi:type IV secretion system protein TrbL
MLRRFGLTGIAAVAVVVLHSAAAHAQAAAPLDSIVQGFQNISASWEAPLRVYATETFALLALLSFAVSGIKLALTGADTSEWLSEMVTQIMTIGFFTLLLLNSVTYGHIIIQSFRLAASGAGGAPISPTSVFNAGLQIGYRIYSQMVFVHPGRDVGLAIGAIVVMICYASIAAEMVVVLVESYIIISAGVIFFAFGGISYTRETAISMLRYTFSVGAKLFILQLLLSVGMGLIDQWVAQQPSAFTLNSFMTIIGSSVVLFVLIKQLPIAIQGVVNGSHYVGGAGGVARTVTYIASTAANVAAGVAGAPVAAMQAARLASSQMGASDKEGGQSRSFGAKAAGMVAGTGANLAKSAASDVGRKLSGQSNGAGSAPWRMSADMGNQRRLLNEDQGSPTPPKATAKTPQNTIS